MSNMGRLYATVQEYLHNNERENALRYLMEKYGFGEKSALEFINQVEDDQKEMS